jgi:hypothetical protein
VFDRRRDDVVAIHRVDDTFDREVVRFTTTTGEYDGFRAGSK